MQTDEKPEMSLLRSMWRKRVRRKTKLIVDGVNYSSESATGSMENSHWKYSAGYGFREALDISYDERKKNKKAYMVWTQGPFLNFKSGDLLRSNDKSHVIQVRQATPMSWNNQSGQMNLGEVLYTLNGSFCDACTQLTNAPFRYIIFQGRNSYRSTRPETRHAKH